MSALYLGYNQIEYIYPILGLPKLASLHLSVNRITSIEGIGQLKWLSSLSLMVIKSMTSSSGRPSEPQLSSGIQSDSGHQPTDLHGPIRSGRREMICSFLKLYLKKSSPKKPDRKTQGIRCPYSILGNGRPSDEGHRMKSDGFKVDSFPDPLQERRLSGAVFFFLKAFQRSCTQNQLERVSMNRLLKDIIDLSRNGFDRSPLS